MRYFYASYDTVKTVTRHLIEIQLLTREQAIQINFALSRPTAMRGFEFRFNRTKNSWKIAERNTAEDCGLPLGTMSPLALSRYQIQQAIEAKTLYCFTGSDILTVLEEFTEWVNQDDADKISYDAWREIKQWTSKEKIALYPSPFYDDPEHTWFLVASSSISSITINEDFEHCLEVINNEFHEHQKPVFPWMEAAETKIEKENDTTMKMPAMNIDFGPVTNGAVALSPYGLAVQDDEGNWFTYNAATGQTLDVTGFTFDFNGMIYKMPAAVSTIAKGDMILHQGKPMYVIGIEGANVSVIDILDSEAKTVIPVSNMFGFNFITKIVSFLNLGNAQPSADQPFGNLMPMMMASALFNGDNGDNAFSNMDIGKLMMFSAMTGNANPFGNLFNWPAGTEAGNAS